MVAENKEYKGVLSSTEGIGLANHSIYVLVDGDKMFKVVAETNFDYIFGETITVVGELQEEYKLVKDKGWEKSENTTIPVVSGSVDVKNDKAVK